MGFGILLIGYVMFFNVQAQNIAIDPFCDLVGYILMLIGLCRLGHYNRGFRIAKALDIALLPVGVLTLLLQIQKTCVFYKIQTPIEALAKITPVYTVVLSVLVLAFHAALYLGIYEMATEVSLEKLRRAALRNLLITAFYYLIMLFLQLFGSLLGDFAKYFNGPMRLYGYVWILLGIVCVFNCYRLICLPGDENMPPRNNLLYRVWNRKKKQEPPKTEAEKIEEAKRAYNEEMRRRQMERTRKNKRGKRR